MGAKPFIFGGLTILLAILYQIRLRDLIFNDFGLGRTYQRIEEFPYTCRKIQHPLLESCEDLVLDSDSRALYAACSKSSARREWSPGLVHHYFRSGDIY